MGQDGVLLVEQVVTSSAVLLVWFLPLWTCNMDL